MDKLFFCIKVTMIKKVARLAFLERGDKKEALITSRRQAEAGLRVPGVCFVAASQSDIWKCMNSDFKVLLEKELMWQAGLTFTSFMGADRKSLLITVHLVLFSCSLHWAPHAPSHNINLRAHTRAHSLYTSCYRLNCVPQIHTLGVLILRTSTYDLIWRQDLKWGH